MEGRTLCQQVVGGAAGAEEGGGRGGLHEHDNESTSSLLCVQFWAKEWSLGCVNSHPVARRSREAGFWQPRDQSFAQPCISGIQSS